MPFLIRLLRSRLLRTGLLAVFLSTSLCLAVTHNPKGQGENPKTTDVTLSNPKLVSSGSGFTASVEVNGGKYPELLGIGDPATLAVKRSKDSVTLQTQSVSSEGTFTFSIGAEESGCKVFFEISGLTGGSATSDSASASSGGSEHGVGSVNSYYDLGRTLAGGSAGQLIIHAEKPRNDIYRPSALQILVTDASVEVIYMPSGSSTPRQILSRTQLTDIVTLSANSYEIRFYTAAQKGTKVGGLYQPTGTPFKTARVENSGTLAINNTDDDLLYATARFEKKFSYSFPVQPGQYRVQLHFADLFFDQTNKAVFDVKAEGEVVLNNYDIIAAAGARNTARIEEITTLVDDGALSLDFVSSKYGAQVSAIKIMRDGVNVANTTDDVLFWSERTGNFSYALPIGNGDYVVELGFVETIFSSAGQRKFDVTVEGILALDDLDIYAEAGARNTALVKTLPVTVTDGQIDIAFVGVTRDALLCTLLIRDANTGTVVVAINAGGPLLATGGQTWSADTGYTGGEAIYPGFLVAAINAGGAGYTAADGTVFGADSNYDGGYAYNGGINSLQITDNEGSTNSVYNYHWLTEPRTGNFTECVLTHPGSLKKEGIQTVWSLDQQSYTEIRTLRNAADNLVSKTHTVYEKFPFGFRKVREVVDPNGAALTTTWVYIEGSENPADPKPDGYGQERSMNRYDGYWEEYTYNADDALTKTVSRYLNSTNRNEANNKVERYTYSASNPVETHVTIIKGQEVARDYVVEYGYGNEFERREITAVNPGAAWNTSNNLVTITRLYRSSHPTALLQGQTKWTQSPDGTMTFYSYATSGDNRVVTKNTGVPNTARTAIVDGIRTITTSNADSQQIGEDVIDIASGLTISTLMAIEVDSLGRPTLVGYGDGTTKEIVYENSSASCGSCSGAGSYRVAQETDRNGITTSYSYDALGRRTGTSRLGVTEQLVYDAADRVVMRKRIGSDSSEIVQEQTTYDLAGRQIASEDALGNVTTIAYSHPAGGGSVTTTTNPATAAGSGTRIETTYADGRVKEIGGTAVSPVRYAYGTWSATTQAGEWTQEIKVGDNNAETEWTKTYINLAGRQTKVEYPDAAYATMSYNALGQLASQTDPDGVITLFAYNAKGEREVTAIDIDQNGVIDYAGTDRITKTVSDVYSKSGTIVRRTITQVWATDNTDVATTVSVSEQDGYGNQGWQTNAAGAVSGTVIARTGAGAWTVTNTAPDGSQQVQTYADGRLVSSTRKNSAGGQVTKTEYVFDPHNRIVTRTDARTGPSVQSYNDRDEVLSVTVNNGADTTSYTYDALGNRLTVTYPNSSVTSSEYHLRNNQLKKTSGQTYPVEYTYDSQGRMKTLTTWQNATTNAGAAVTTWNYDAQRGWLTQKLYADSTGPAYTFTGAGRLLSRTWGRTVSGSPLVTTYGYNNAGNLIITNYSDTTPDVAVTYTRFGAQATVTDATGTSTLTYTAALQADQEQLPAFYGNRIFSRSYETTGTSTIPGRVAGFLLGTSADPDSDYAVSYGYDNAGRLNNVTDPDGSFTYGYLANSNLRAGIIGPVHTVAYSYESHRDVVTSIENKVGVTTVSRYDYTVNSLGERIQRQQSGTAFVSTSTDVFTYNAKGEVMASTNATFPDYNRAFAYDDIGNRTSHTDTTGTTAYAANSLNQYIAITAATPTHDADGNMIATGTGTRYIWDAENRLVSVEPVVPLPGDQKQQNTYDAQSRRVRKQVFIYDVLGSWNLMTDEKFIYDDWNLIAVLNVISGNALLRTHTWGLDLSDSLQDAGGIGGLLSVKETDGTFAGVKHFTFDANGNVSEVLNTSGVLVAHYEYDAFGNTIASSGTYQEANPWRFSTKLLDSTGSLYYFGYRYHNPSIGRWLNRDPIGISGGVNLYSFVNNSPVGMIDPNGKILIITGIGFPKDYNRSREPSPTDHLRPPFGPDKGDFVNNTDWFEAKFQALIEQEKKLAINDLNKKSKQICCKCPRPTGVQELPPYLHVGVLPADDYWTANALIGHVSFKSEDHKLSCNETGYRWTATLVIHDRVGFDSGDEWFRQPLRWTIFPDRNITRARILISGDGQCE